MSRSKTFSGYYTKIERSNDEVECICDETGTLIAEIRRDEQGDGWVARTYTTHKTWRATWRANVTKSIATSLHSSGWYVGRNTKEKRTYPSP